MNIVLTRVDDRLIHGQVMTSWVSNVRGNKIIIVDDQVATDSFMQYVLTMMAPPGIKIMVYTVKEAVEELKKPGESNDRVIILVKTPGPVYTLIENGVEIKELNIGGMGSRVGRKALFRNIYASPEERDVFRNIVRKGVVSYIRIVPDDKGVDVQKYL